MEDQKQQTQKVFCCPSKVLIMGGYAILSQQCVGLSVGLNERFYSYVTPLDQTSEQESNIRIIKFVSKQIESEWSYELNLSNKQINPSTQSKNPFLESVVQILIEEGLSEISQISRNIQVNIYHDNRFYSFESKKKEQTSEYFSLFDKNNLHKTGLGSSACVLVVTLGTLLKYYNEFSEDRLHYLSQKANFIAQKKIGSGFDIATSVFGSQVYRRFPPEIFSLKDETEYSWNSYQRFNIPKELKVMMIDLSIGSDTRLLAGEIKKYLDSHPSDSEPFYSQCNQKAFELQEIFSSIKNSEDLIKQKESIRELNKSYRKIFKNIGVLSKVETEPDVLSKILDEIMINLPQIFYGVCPGAGGYDALCLLTDHTLTVECLQQEINKINLNHPSIQKMTVQEIDISLQGFRELDTDSTVHFFKHLL